MRLISKVLSYRDNMKRAYLSLTARTPRRGAARPCDIKRRCVFERDRKNIESLKCANGERCDKGL